MKLTKLWNIALLILDKLLKIADERLFKLRLSVIRSNCESKENQ